GFMRKGRRSCSLSFSAWGGGGTYVAFRALDPRAEHGLATEIRGDQKLWIRESPRDSLNNTEPVRSLIEKSNGVTRQRQIARSRLGHKRRVSLDRLGKLSQGHLCKASCIHPCL